MKQLDKELDLAVGRRCPICDEPMTKHGNGKHSATREHLKPRSTGATLSCFDGHNKLIICRHCNGALKKNAMLVDFLLQLLRAGDAIRAEGVAGIIADIYGALGEDSADELVGMIGMCASTAVVKPKKAAPKTPVESPTPPGRRCIFPRCACARTCERHGRLTAKDGAG